MRWCAPAPLDGAARAVQRAAARLASRAALAEAIGAWRAAYGEAPWQRAAVVHDVHGAPRFDAEGAPALALAHTIGLGGAAIAGPGASLAGIDAEPVDAPGARALRQLAERTGESSLPWSDEHWPLRLWCAKEVVVKAERVPADLLGRTLRIELVESAVGLEQRVSVRSHLGRVHRVVTTVHAGHVRAWIA